MPSMRDSFITSRCMPRACTSSIIVRTRSIGMSSCRAWATRPRLRGRVVASTTRRSASGRSSPGNVPARRSCTIASAALSGSRL
jgi:hypothetical protein